uniref:hypothetical protein n=1 Tax=Teredinibacter waterburyi TaxID=1500538 RepID=UPI001CAA84C6
MVERTFKNIPDGKINDLEQESSWSGFEWSAGDTWSDLLQSRRVLIIPEAGSGKTYECKEQAKRLRDAGEAAFFVELSSLATSDLRDLLDPPDEVNRLDMWLSSQSGTATFFLDSFDELKLSAGSFEVALKRLKKIVYNKLRDVKIVITTRPTSYDENVVRRLLPAPDELTLTDFNEETFADIAVSGNSEVENSNKAPEWRSVILNALSDKQIQEFAGGRDELETLKRCAIYSRSSVE